MKKFYMLIIGLIMLCGAKAQWIPQNSGTTNPLYSVYFTDSNTGYAVGYGGTILKTSDGGLNWTIQSSGTDAFLRVIYFPTSNTGFAAGNGILLKTSDGGENWEKLQDEVIENGEWFSIDFTNSLEGNIAGTYNGEGCILKTYDTGNNWSAIYNGVEDTNCFYVGGSNFYSIHYIDSNIGFALGSYYCGSQTMGHNVNLLLKSSNAGVDWERQTFCQKFNGYRSLFFTDSLTGYIIGGNRWGWGEGYDSLVKTTDGGTNWFTSNIGTDTGWVHLWSLFFTDADTGFLVGSFGNIFKTEDGGENYFMQNSGTTNRLNSIYFTDSNIGYIVGDSGTILKSTNGGGSSTGTEESPIQPSTFNLQHYPNPTSGIVDFRLSMADVRWVSLKIYNVQGQEVATVLDGKWSGDQVARWDAGALPAGIYYYRLTTDDRRLTTGTGKIMKY